MKIKNKKVLEKLKNFSLIKTGCLFISAVAIVTTLAACSSVEPVKYNPSAYVVSKGVTEEQTKKTFKAGEHIISVPIEKDPVKDRIQHEYIDGYKVIGLSTTSYGQYHYSFEGATVVYVNDIPVECISSGIDENNIPVYTNAGTPLEKEEKEIKTTAETRDFNEGEHIISVPVEIDPTKNNIQYKYYDGYEFVGISSSAYGKYHYNFEGASALYVNSVPVKCNVTSYDENNKGSYLDFGKPIQLEKSFEKVLQ